MYERFLLDEKWFCVTEAGAIYYLAKDETSPVKSV